MARWVWGGRCHQLVSFLCGGACSCCNAARMMALAEGVMAHGAGVVACGVNHLITLLFCCSHPGWLPPQAPSNTHSLSKRDAVAFVCAARRYSLQSRLADVAAEVGGAVDQAEPQAQQLLWAELEQGCQRALELAAEQDKMQGQLRDPRVNTGVCCLHSSSMQRCSC